MINSVYQAGFQNFNPYYYQFQPYGFRYPGFYYLQDKITPPPPVNYKSNTKLNTQSDFKVALQSILNQQKSLPTNKPQTSYVNRSVSSAHHVATAHDGKFSGKEAAKNFIKGFISPLTGMFESVKNFMIGAGILLGGAALVIATHGLAAPLLVGAGICMGVIQAFIAAKKIHNAKNGDDIEEAFFEIGAATVAMAVSVIGARSSLHSAEKLVKLSPEQINRMSLYKATMENLKACPASLRETLHMFKNGKIITHLKQFIAFLAKESVHLIDPQIELVTGKSLKSVVKTSVGKSVRLSLADLEGEIIRGKLPKISLAELEGKIRGGKLSGLSEFLPAEEISSVKLPRYLLVELKDEMMTPKALKSPVFEIHGEIVPSQVQREDKFKKAV